MSINVNMTSADGVTLATSGKYCADNIRVKRHNDPVTAEPCYDPNLWIKVRFDIAPTPYTVVETWGFNTSGTNMAVLDRIGQAVNRYNRSGDRNSNIMGIAINGVNEIGASVGVGRIEITQTGDVRIYSRSNNFAIRPSKYTVEVNWNA